MRYLLLAAALLLLPWSQAAGQTTDKSALLQGVGKLPTPVEPDAICTTISLTERPEIVLTARAEPGSAGQSFDNIAVVSSRLGKGKVLVFSTAAYFRAPLVQDAAVRRLLANCIAWGGGAAPRRVQVWGGDAALTAFLTRTAGVRLVGTAAAPDPTAQVLLIARELTDTLVIRRVEQFVRRGGTLLYGSPLPDRPRTAAALGVDLPFNRLLRPAGLLQSAHLIVTFGPGAYLSTDPAPDYLGLSNILRTMRANTFPTATQLRGSRLLSYTLTQALEFHPAGSPVGRLLARAAHYQADSLIVPTATAPVRQGKGSRYLAYLVQQHLLEDELRAHPNPAYVAPAAATFPGAVPAGGRVTAALALPVRVGSHGTLEPDPVYRRPHGTGLYVPPGERVIISLAGPDSLRHLEAQIGVHSDDLTHLTSFAREAFDLTRHFELKHGRTEIYSPYGGLLLLNIPDTTSLQELRVTVAGAVRAPRFELGKTSLADWQQTIRQYSAPWAELVSDNVSLTVPAARIRALADPAAVLTFWDAVLAADARLAALPTVRRHAERIIVDQDVAYGYMFTAPDKIIIPDDASCPQMLDAAFMQKTGNWGIFHELGHRHQFWSIDFAELGEVSVNLYTLYVFDQVLHKGLFNHPQIPNRQEVGDKATWYMEDHPSLAKWGADPFLALSMYVQLIHAFGWAPIEQVYRQYRQLPKSQYPATEAAKRDYWFAAISTATRRNLAPFFAQWQVPVGEEAAKAVARYPTWLPPEMQKK